MVHDRAAYHTRRILYPVGFMSERTYASYRHPGSTTVYTCEVLDAGDRPQVCMLAYADVCWRMLTYAGVCWRMLAYAGVLDAGDRPPGPPSMSTLPSLSMPEQHVFALHAIYGLLCIWHRMSSLERLLFMLQLLQGVAVEMQLVYMASNVFSRTAPLYVEMQLLDVAENVFSRTASLYVVDRASRQRSLSPLACLSAYVSIRQHTSA